MSYSAEFAGKDEDASLKQHAGVELEQVPHIDCHNQLCQVPLVHRHTHTFQFEWATYRLQNPTCFVLDTNIEFSLICSHVFRDGRETSGVWSDEVGNLVKIDKSKH